MIVQVQIRTDNAAFIDNPDQLAALFHICDLRARRVPMSQLKEHLNDSPLYDDNGNKVGQITVIVEPHDDA